MDYTTSPLIFRIKKVLRFVRHYGVMRTWRKVQSQYHMKKTYDHLPDMQVPETSKKHVGIIGAGNYPFSTIAHYVTKNHGAVIRGAMDIDINRAASMYEHYGLDYYTDDPARIPNDTNIDLVYIASNHASHAEYAIECLKAGKSVHIEKPHVVREDQLIRLCQAMEESPGAVNLGFNRPHSRIGNLIRDHLWSQQGPAMLNWFVAGHEIAADHWYFKEEEGGRILGNLCHWTDFLFQLVPPEDRYPITINPTRAERSDCDIAVTYVFGDGTIGIITFSAKGHTFEGVRERFSAHRGDVLVAMDDFQSLRIEIIDRKLKLDGRHRDHGHQRGIVNSYDWSRATDPKTAGLSVDYVWETGQLFLKTKEALEQRKSITLQPYDEAQLKSRPPV